MATEVIELHGDRLFRDDPAIVGGFCRIDGRRAVFVGHQKGDEVNENIRRNFGMPHPEGYRKAIRLYQLAERLQLPVVTFIDTPGAFPGPASEERGVAEAIARSIQVMAGLKTPIVTVITGEGGSGGALALAVGDVVLALENSIYSVISPEGAASILWRSPDYAQQAAVAMRLTATEQLALGVIDEVVPEPPGARTRIPTKPRSASAAGSHIISTLSPAATGACCSMRATPDIAAWASSPRSRRRATSTLRAVVGQSESGSFWRVAARHSRAGTARRCRAASQTMSRTSPCVRTSDDEGRRDAPRG